MATITNVLATDSLASGKTKINTNFVTLNTDKLEFSQNGDFYKYQISRTVDGSGNMTITYLNYLGATPSASAPVKVQIGGVVYTITNALSFTSTAGANFLNLGSAELATKEVDIFTYLFYSSVDLAVGIGISRIPGGITLNDFSGTNTNEKGFLTGYSKTSTDSVVNIGCFNAILSGGAGYTWSVPATSVIVNRPIYESREKSINAIISGSGGAITTQTIVNAKYSIQNSRLFFDYKLVLTDKGTASGIILVTLPFLTSRSDIVFTGGITNSGDNPFTQSKGQAFSSSSGAMNFIKAMNSANTQFSDVLSGSIINVTGNYQI